MGLLRRIDDRVAGDMATHDNGRRNDRVVRLWNAAGDARQGGRPAAAAEMTRRATGIAREIPAGERCVAARILTRTSD